MSQTSAALGRIQPSATLAMSARVNALKAQGVDVIGLSAGEPDFDTPDFVKEAGIAAIRNNLTRYTDVDGTADVKEAVMFKFQRDNGLTYKRSQITVNSGGKHTLFNALVATVDAGDEVIIPATYWVSYPDIVNFAGGTPVFIEGPASQGYKITAAQLEAAITPRTKWVMLNSPSNPSGAAYSAAELKELADVLLRHPHVLIMTDDMYEHVWYATTPFATIAQVCPELYDRTLTVNGCSKAFSMTGWRIGFAGGPEWIIKAMGKLQSQSTSNPCSISQAAAVAAPRLPDARRRFLCLSRRQRRDRQGDAQGGDDRQRRNADRLFPGRGQGRRRPWRGLRPLARLPHQLCDVGRGAEKGLHPHPGSLRRAEINLPGTGLSAFFLPSC